MKSVFALAAALLLPAALSAASVAPKYVIVSDIDDTIQKTQIHWKTRPISALKNLLNSRDAFVGMPTLYNALAAQGMDFHYVTGAPKIIQGLPIRFLKDSGFPPGPLWVRASVFTSTIEHKFNRIKILMLQQPEAQFILIGDNGEHDIEIYKLIQHDPEVGHRVAASFIHRLYGPVTGAPMEPGQVAFLSTAELALDLKQSGLLPEPATLQILKEVDNGLKSRSKSVENLTIPEFAYYDESSIEALLKRGDQDPNPVVQELVRSIATSMADGLSEHKRNQLLSAPFPDHSNMSCRRVLM